LKETNIKILWPNNIETFVSEGDDWFSSAEKAGLEIPTGCLTGSCGACEIDVDGETVRACISDIKKYIKSWESDKNLILVTHFVVISSILNIGTSSGEMIISDKNYNIIDNNIFNDF